MATRFRRSFITKMSSMLFICKSFFQLSDQKIPRLGMSARTKGRSEGRSSPDRQVSLLGRGQSCRVGKMANFAGVWFMMCVMGASVLGPSRTSAQELNPGDAMDVYRTVDRWARQWEVDEEWGGGSVPLHSCLSVTLRLDGLVIGRGQVVVDSMDSGPGTVVQAAREAMAQARGWVRKKSEDEPSVEQWGSIGSRVVLSVEIARDVVPMSESALSLPGLGLSPGVHGLVMRLGERVEVMSPDEMVTLGFTPEKAAYSMATALSGDGAMALASIDELVERGYSFARFEPVWIAQPEASAGGVFLDRGGRVIEESSVGVRSVRAMGERIAGYLMAQRWPGSERYGMVGTRDVVSGRASPEVSPVYEQALVAYSLFKFGEMGRGLIHERARLAAFGLIQDLGAVQPGEPAPWEDGVSSAACMIPMTIPRDGFFSPEEIRLETECRKTLEGLYSPIDGFSTEIPAGARGLVAWALVRSNHKYAEHAVRSVFRDTEPGQLVGQMPFLGWAEMELARGKDEVPASGSLGQMRNRMWDHQLGRSDLETRDRDFVGAVVFTSGGGVLPASGNLRPIAMACSMLGDERLTPGTIVDGAMASEIGKVASSMRFVDQLVMSQDSAFLSRAPERCVGGVRASLWEWKVSPASSAIALLAAVEFERSIKAIGARTAPAEKP